MQKKFALVIVISLCLLLTACGGNTIAPSDTTSSNMADSTEIPDAAENDADIQTEDEPTSESAPLYFESDETVDKFFTDYNAIAEVPIPADEIEKGNIRTKALVYIDDLSLEIINAPDSLSISMSSSVENEQTLLYSVFRDSILAVRAEVTEDEIKSAWDTIHESGPVDLNEIHIFYSAPTELSWGTTDLRIDLDIPK